MNIYDYPQEFTKEHIPDMWNYIWQRQLELSEKYIPIEAELGLRWTTDHPVDLNDAKGQAQLKDLSWRVVEEVGESLESWSITKDSDDHMKEELADALHFMVELVQTSGLSLGDLKGFVDSKSDYMKGNNDYTNHVTNFIIRLSMVMNCLKMKPWKQTPYKTDILKYKAYLLEAFYAFYLLLRYFLTDVEILNYYFAKSEVNKFRQDSKY